ncbi:DUF222 domain-containing protein [Rhodococcus oryzae]|uniref:DUF222 domain-containing protein n=1 Tax=Rhodococcus oryzae TaxID=2571143 RepID=A0ABY2RF65_9NOCA|nr:DUF222 domain-containing protein [Rhodococcus oryzae]
MHLAELLDRPQDVVAWQIGERELVALLPELSTRIRQLEALRVRLAQEAAFRGAVTLTGASSAEGWLAESSKLTPGHAKRVMSLGADLDRFPDVKASFENGDIDSEQARSIIGLLLKVPDYTSDIKNSANGGDFDDPAAECASQCTTYLLTNGARENAEDTRRWPRCSNPTTRHHPTTRTTSSTSSSPPAPPVADCASRDTSTRPPANNS